MLLFFSIIRLVYSGDYIVFIIQAIFDVRKARVHLGSYQISMMELFSKIANDFLQKS